MSLLTKPPVARLYGRRRGPALRARQRLLLELALPRFAFSAKAAGAFGSAAGGLWVEIGSGGGEHAAAFAQADPARTLIACEVYENGLCSLLARLVAEGEEATALPPANLRIWPADGRQLLVALPPAALAGLVLLFPDPWPKARHTKRRFIHPLALDGIAAKLRPGAEWRVATDDPQHQAWIAEVMAAQPYFSVPAPLPERPSGWPPTRYEAKALASGHQPLYWTFRRLG